MKYIKSILEHLEKSYKKCNRDIFRKPPFDQKIEFSEKEESYIKSYLNKNFKLDNRYMGRSVSDITQASESKKWAWIICIYDDVNHIKRGFGLIDKYFIFKYSDEWYIIQTPNDQFYTCDQWESVKEFLNDYGIINDPNMEKPDKPQGFFKKIVKKFKDFK